MPSNHPISVRQSITLFLLPFRPTKSSPDVTEYEEIGASRDLQSGAIVKKMKDRPLPPPPRPDRTLPRGRKGKTGDPSAVDGDEDDKKPSDDRGGGAERIVDCAHERTADENEELERAQYTPPLPIDQQMGFEEMDISTQTEPLPEDYVCDELDISADMKTITPTQSKTLEDILKEEQEAEFERAQQQVAEVSLSRGLQRFRDANQRSISEKSWASRDRPKTPLSTHISPHASALRMNIESFVEAERQGVSQQVSAVNIVDHETEENEMNRNIVDQQSEKEDTNDKILNLEEHARDGEEIRATAVQVLQSVESEIERQAQRLENIIDRLSSEGSPPGSPPIVRARPPMAPPRRKSSIEDPRLTGIVNDFSNRLQLDVDRLNVNQLNAGNITAQDIHTGTISTNEMRSQGGWETSAASIPEDVINQIAARILNSEQMQSRVTAANQQSTAPAPPSGFFAIPTEYLNSLPPPSFYQLRDPDEGVHEEKKTKTQENKVAQDPQEGTSTGEQPSVLRLGGEFLNACGGAFMRNVRELMNMIPSSLTKEGAEETSSRTGRRDINVILLILIIIIVCLLAFAMGGGRTVHHHHWDFFNPPGSESLD